MTQEIKPCPFCFGTPVCYVWPRNIWLCCEKGDCEHSSPRRETKEQAIEAWNKIADALAAYDAPEDEPGPNDCGHCGSETSAVRMGKAWYVTCDNDDCAASGPVGDSEQEAIRKYNKE